MRRSKIVMGEVVIDFSNRDIIADMADGLRRGAEAIEKHGYKLYSYEFHTPHIGTGDPDNPEAALQDLLDQIREREWSFEVKMDGDLLADLYGHGTEDDMKDAINWSYSRLVGKINMGEQEVPEFHPLHLEVDIIYRLDTRGDYFEIVNYDGHKGVEFSNEVEEILTDEEFVVQNNA